MYAIVFGDRALELVQHDRRSIRRCRDEWPQARLLMLAESRTSEGMDDVVGVFQNSRSRLPFCWRKKSFLRRRTDTHRVRECPSNARTCTECSWIAFHICDQLPPKIGCIARIFLSRVLFLVRTKGNRVDSIPLWISINPGFWVEIHRAPSRRHYAFHNLRSRKSLFFRSRRIRSELLVVSRLRKRRRPCRSRICHLLTTKVLCRAPVNATSEELFLTLARSERVLYELS
ncbi:MAG: hypothetical protein AMJ84_02405 [Acidithiobacillales bacterium SM23_46]|nr:MAG: hypothetical protein AMJ84_02405 [Acidithiobacillales bacterium SM23_46]